MRPADWLIGILLLSGIILIAQLTRPRKFADDALALIADHETMTALLSEEDAFWPARSRNLEAMDDWLERARGLAERIPRFRAALEEAGGEASDDSSTLSLQRSLRRLLRGAERLVDPNPRRGAIAGVESRRRLARDLRKLTIEDAWELWRAAVTSITDRDACPFYGGFRLSPQEGLLPLGPDPMTGFWEFGHLLSGEVRRRGADDQLETGPDTGLVFVLLPGSALGEPFFASKFELTQAQWERIASLAPADDLPSSSTLLGDLDSELIDRVLRRLGLALPDPVQWEVMITSRLRGEAGSTEPPPTGLVGEMRAERRPTFPISKRSAKSSDDD